MEVVQQLTLAEKYKEAQALALRLEEAYRQRDGEGSERHARTLHVLAEIYRLSGEPGKAEPIQREACIVAQRVFGEAHAVYGICLNNLATILQRQGKLSEAEELHRRALDIRLRLPLSPDLAQSLANLAATANSLGRHRDAEALYQEALHVIELTLGRSHPQTASVLNNLAVFYRERGRAADAEPLLRRVVDIFLAISAIHPDAAVASVNLATCLAEQSKLDEAEPVLREALDLMQRQGLNPSSTIVVAARNELGRLLLGQQRNGEAQSVFLSVLSDIGSTPADIRSISEARASDPQRRASLQGLGDALNAQGLLDQARDKYREALQIGSRSSSAPDGPVRLIRAKLDDVERLLAAKPGSTEHGRASLPELPWPPPTASTWDVLPNEVVLSGVSATPSLGAVSRRIERALDAAGYHERSYFRIPSGIAIVSRLERIGTDGIPDAARRWQPVNRDEAFTLMSYLRRLLYAEEGRYRLLVLLLTELSFSASGDALSPGAAQSLVGVGTITLPREVGELQYGDAHRTTALIYEFEKIDQNPPRLVLPSALPGRIHLVRGQIWPALEGQKP